VVTLRDLDGDGIPDRDDPDIDGDGVSNEDELLAGTDPYDADTDGDGAPDGVDRDPLKTNRVPVVAAGGALRFDGVDDFVDAGNPAAFQLTGDQTIEFWLKPANFNVRRNPIAKAFAGEGTMTIETDGRINYFYGINGGNTGSGGVDYQGFPTASPLRLNEWHHLALVRDLTAMKLRWYLNGELLNEADALFPAAVAGNLPFYIGRGYVSNVAGEMDEVRVWNVARTTAEIQSLRLARATGDEPGLAATWSFEEAAGSLVRDYSPNWARGRLGGDFASAMPERIAATTPLGEALIEHGLAGTPIPVQLTGSDADGDPLSFVITALPASGGLHQTSDGVTKGAAITEVPATVTDPQRRVIYESAADFTGVARFTYRLNDGQDDSRPAGVEVRVLPVN
jgi:hypothetical protein